MLVYIDKIPMSADVFIKLIAACATVLIARATFTLSSIAIRVT